MLILNIDTAIDKGSFCISDNDNVLAFDLNENRNEQAGWLQDAIDAAFKKREIDPKTIDAIAVSNGPGSYTGLRIGLATAKGLCYALSKPLICISTLQILASSIRNEVVDLVCPMIDARRMEVFTAFYDKVLNTVKEPFAEILSADSFLDISKGRHVTFTGNGCEKFRSLTIAQNFSFINKNVDARDIIPLSTARFQENIFEDVAYCQPYYVKDVYINGKVKR